MNNAAHTFRADPPTTQAATLPAGVDWLAAAMLLLGLAALYIPTYLDLSRRIWPSDEQGHGPIILVLSLWLLWRKRAAIAALPSLPERGLAAVFLVMGALLYAFGRTQGILMFEVSSQILILIALLLLFVGRAALRLAWFPLFFMLFMVPLPGSVVASLTGPLKSAVSAVAESLLHGVGYPVARAGVILSIGQYQLLVADVCAGLNSMFTLEALGLLYMNLMNSTRVARNVTLAVLIIPISFISNIIRVMILVLVTYHFGDEAGQGFVHRFAGMVLFIVGLLLMMTTDKLLRLVFKDRDSHQ